jgi:hypothetical protein
MIIKYILFYKIIKEKMYRICMDMIEGIDMYLRSLTKENDFHIFCDEKDIILYRDTTPHEMMEYTRKTLTDFLKTISPCYKIDKDTLLVICVSCFILSVKFYLDCGLCKPYSVVWGIIENEFDNPCETDFSFLLKRSIYMEKKILKETNFFVDKIDL